MQRGLDTANIQAEVGLKEGTNSVVGLHRLASIKGPNWNANINVANNQIQDGSSVVANKPLDTLAFTSVKGGYVKDNGELMADVRGWFDMGISRISTRNGA